MMDREAKNGDWWLEALKMAVATLPVRYSDGSEYLDKDDVKGDVEAWANYYYAQIAAGYKAARESPEPDPTEGRYRP